MPEPSPPHGSPFSPPAAPPPDDAVIAALGRLLDVVGTDTGQGREAADFLLAWWNAKACGGWDPTDLWNVGHAVAGDMLPVVGFISRRHLHPDALGFGAGFEALVALRRPHPLARPA